jgi:putative oxidoreductase
MKIVTLIARLLLGLIFVVFGLNGFLNFINMGPMPSGLAGQFIGALAQSHYFWVVAALQVAGGACCSSIDSFRLRSCFLGQ